MKTLIDHLGHDADHEDPDEDHQELFVCLHWLTTLDEPQL